ncbi:MAG TPA: DUF4189 domain-containing protein [Bryobacteraceae bacterium]|jgi:hypothetical protein
MRPLISKGRTLLLLLLVLGLKEAPPTSLAAGDCLYDCEGSTCYDFGNHTTFCQEQRAKCQARCSGRRLWGAIAYSKPDGEFGWTIKWNTEAEAKKDAMARCVKTGKACEMWATFENSCGAVAADGNIVTWGTANVQSSAEQRAVAECQKAGGRNCKVAVWACSKL